MPKMDGSQLITEMKKDPSTAAIWKDIDITQPEKALHETLGAES
jgi:hypothetical protein